MANTTSAQKAMRQAERRAVRNQAARSAVRTFAKKASAVVRGSAASAGDDTAKMVREAVSALDKAAQKGIIHRNAAARGKSRLMAQLHKLTLAAAAPPEPQPATRAPSRRATASAKAAGRTRRTTTTRKPSSRTKS